MTAHELARILFEGPDLPVATHANNHTYMGGLDAGSHGPLRVARLHTYGGEHVLIGNPSKNNINGSNWKITEMLDGGSDLPDEWERWIVSTPR